MKGVVKFFNDEKGWGFIMPEGAERGGEVFVHFTAIQMGGRKTLQEGDAVEFEVVKSDKGPKAANVVKV